ncbi:hypothetical protein M3Y99_01044300 [Aphelenchoides fujianensis]|nr:hypothetical protein M3Y99_01044300 [Aphelenchoides fujianensis]
MSDENAPPKGLENVPPGFQPFPTTSADDVPNEKQLFHFSQESAKLLKFFEQRADEEQKAIDRFLDGGSPMIVQMEPPTMPPSLFLQPVAPVRLPTPPSHFASPVHRQPPPPRRAASFSESSGRGQRRGYSPQTPPRQPGPPPRARHGSFNGQTMPPLNYFRNTPPPAVHMSHLPHVPPHRPERPHYVEHTPLEATILHVMRVARRLPHKALLAELKTVIDQNETVNETAFHNSLTHLASLQNLSAEYDDEGGLIYSYRD